MQTIMHCQECTAGTLQNAPWHISSYESSSAGCDFDCRSGSNTGEQNFGRYYAVYKIISAHCCTSNQQSTTQHWIGSKL